MGERLYDFATTVKVKTETAVAAAVVCVCVFLPVHRFSMAVLNAFKCTGFSTLFHHLPERPEKLHFHSDVLQQLFSTFTLTENNNKVEIITITQT